MCVRWTFVYRKRYIDTETLSRLCVFVLFIHLTTIGTFTAGDPFDPFDIKHGVTDAALDRLYNPVDPKQSELPLIKQANNCLRCSADEMAIRRSLNVESQILQALELEINMAMDSFQSSGHWSTPKMPGWKRPPTTLKEWETFVHHKVGLLSSGPSGCTFSVDNAPISWMENVDDICDTLAWRFYNAQNPSSHSGPEQYPFVYL